MEGIAASGAARAIPCLHPERHQLPGDRRRRGAALRRTEGEMARPARRSPTGGAPRTPASRPATSATSASAGARDYDFAVSSMPTASRPRTRSCAWCASCRSSRSSASCRAWWSACRRPARSRASSSSACGSACAPTRSAARGGRATAAPTGGTTRSSALAPFIAHCHLPPRAGRQRNPQPRPDRGRADAPRRIRGARAARGRRELGGEPADADGIHPPRPALGAGQHAVLAASWCCPGYSRSAATRSPSRC